MKLFKPSTIDINSLIKKIIPQLTSDKLKGENGTVAVIGGSLEYTGAPYYTAITSLKAGNDLSHVFCHTEAAIPIKCYSPELIVHPAFNQPDNTDLINKTLRWFKSMHSIAMGPGLGRDDTIESIFTTFTSHVNKVNTTLPIPTVFDADALWFFGKTFNKTFTPFDKGNLIITPNNSEFNRLIGLLLIKENYDQITPQNQFKNIDGIDNKSISILKYNANEIPVEFKNEIDLCNTIHNNIIVKKGVNDVITNGKELYIVKNEGSLKRCGGIGDVLTGLINCYCGMIYKNALMNNKTYCQSDLMECCVLGCFICREASRLAFNEKGYSLTAPDIIDKLCEVTNKLYNNKI